MNSLLAAPPLNNLSKFSHISYQLIMMILNLKISAIGIEIIQTTKYKNKKCLDLREIRVFGYPGGKCTTQ